MNIRNQLTPNNKQVNTIDNRPITGQGQRQAQIQNKGQRNKAHVE